VLLLYQFTVLAIFGIIGQTPSLLDTMEDFLLNMPDTEEPWNAFKDPALEILVISGHNKPFFISLFL
jgi:hypothetical protein